MIDRPSKIKINIVNNINFTPNNEILNIHIIGTLTYPYQLNFNDYYLATLYSGTNISSPYNEDNYISDAMPSGIDSFNALSISPTKMSHLVTPS